MAAEWLKIQAEVLARKDISASAKLVYSIIADRMGNNGKAWPGMRRIAADCGIGIATAHDAVKRLEAVGLLTVEHPQGNPAGKCNVYKLTPERAENRTFGNNDVSETERRTYLKPNAERTENRTKPDQVNQTKITRPKRARFDPLKAFVEELTLNTCLNTPKVHEAWGIWCASRAERKKPLTPTSVKLQIKQLEEMGHDRAVEALLHSARNGYQGVFEPSSTGAGQRKPEDRDAERRKRIDQICSKIEADRKRGDADVD